MSFLPNSSLSLPQVIWQASSKSLLPLALPVLKTRGSLLLRSLNLHSGVWQDGKGSGLMVRPGTHLGSFLETYKIQVNMFGFSGSSSLYLPQRGLDQVRTLKTTLHRAPEALKALSSITSPAMPVSVYKLDFKFCLNTGLFCS